MYEQILQNYLMGILSARETADKLLGAGFPEDMKTVMNEKIRENMERILVELRSFNRIVEQVNEILEMTNLDREITSRQFCKEGILIKEFSVIVYSPWTDAKGTFGFDNYCEQDNAAEFEAFEKFIGEN